MWAAAPGAEMRNSVSSVVCGRGDRFGRTRRRMGERWPVKSARRRSLSLACSRLMFHPMGMPIAPAESECVVLWGMGGQGRWWRCRVDGDARGRMGWRWPEGELAAQNSEAPRLRHACATEAEAEAGAEAEAEAEAPGQAPSPSRRCLLQPLVHSLP